MGLFDGFMGGGTNYASPLMGLANSRTQSGHDYAGGLMQSAQGIPTASPFTPQLGAPAGPAAQPGLGAPDPYMPKTGGAEPMMPPPMVGGPEPMPPQLGAPTQQPADPRHPGLQQGTDPRHPNGFAGAFLGGINRLSGGAVGNALGQAGVPQSQYMGGGIDGKGAGSPYTF